MAMVDNKNILLDIITSNGYGGWFDEGTDIYIYESKSIKGDEVVMYGQREGLEHSYYATLDSVELTKAKPDFDLGI